MKKRTVGIYARYDASEQSFCAEYLAGYVSKCYRYVKWFVPAVPARSGPYYGFSHQWDTEVVTWNGNRRDAVKTAALCDTCFFFEPNDDLLRRLPRDAVTAFVADPRNWTQEIRDFADSCTYLLWPGQTWMPRKTTSVPHPNLLVWPFDPSLPGAPRRGIDYEKQPRLFFPAFGFNSEERRFAGQVAQIVKMCKPNVQTVLCYYDATVKPQPGEDSRTHDWRLLRYLHHTDWIVDLNRSPLYGLFNAFAGTYGLQWIGFDTPPCTDPMNGARRHLIRERIDDDGRVAPDLESTAMQIVQRLETPFHGDADRHRGTGCWDHRRAEYLRVTNIVLGNKTKY